MLEKQHPAHSASTRKNGKHTSCAHPELASASSHELAMYRNFLPAYAVFQTLS